MFARKSYFQELLKLYLSKDGPHKKLGFQTGKSHYSIYSKSMRYVSSRLIRPAAPIFCVRYRSFLPGLGAEFLLYSGPYDVCWVYFCSITVVQYANLWRKIKIFAGKCSFCIEI